MRTIAAALLVVLVTACGQASEDSDAAPSISFTRGGGLTGDAFRLEIRPDGAAIVEINEGLDERTIEFELSEAEHERLLEHLERSDVGGLGEARSDCGDCFDYSLEFGDETAGADSVTAAEAFFEAVDPLEKLLRRRLPADSRY